MPHNYRFVYMYFIKTSSLFERMLCPIMPIITCWANDMMHGMRMLRKRKLLSYKMTSLHTSMINFNIMVFKLLYYCMLCRLFFNVQGKHAAVLYILIIFSKLHSNHAADVLVSLIVMHWKRMHDQTQSCLTSIDL